MLEYILQTVLFQLIFLVIYDVFLKKETFFNWNRLYLIVTTFLSVGIPLVKIEKFQTILPSEYMYQLPEIILGEPITLTNTTPLLGLWTIENQTISKFEIIILLGSIAMFIVLLSKLYKVFKLISNNPKVEENGIVIVRLPDNTSAFSFLKYVFIGDHINKDDVPQIIYHEKIHVKQNHTIDLLLFEVLRIIFWYNPFIYIYQNRVSELHEFIADSKAIKFHDQKNYYENLLTQIFNVKDVSFVNTFFNKSLIKKRLNMLSKSKSKQISKLKYALLVPIVFGMLIYSSCAQNSPDKTEIAQIVDSIKNQINTNETISDIESDGFDILRKAFEASEIDPNVIKSLQEYLALTNQSELTETIHKLFEEIQKQGNISDDDVDAINELVALTSKDKQLAQNGTKQEVSMKYIDQVPVYPGCEDLSNEDQKKCLIEKITSHVNSQFNADVAKDMKLVGQQRIIVKFIISKEGAIEGVEARAPHESLVTEAVRVVNELPAMKPGIHKGKPVDVPYSLPIIFVIKE